MLTAGRCLSRPRRTSSYTATCGNHGGSADPASGVELDGDPASKVGEVASKGKQVRRATSVRWRGDEAAAAARWSRRGSRFSEQRW